MNDTAHKQRHLELHRSFDELIGDWIAQTNPIPSKATVMDLINWSYKQSRKPDHEA